MRGVQACVPVSMVLCCPQGELAVKEVGLAAASAEAEKLLGEISRSTAVAEQEKAKVAVIVADVSQTAQARDCCLHLRGMLLCSGFMGLHPGRL